MPYYFDLQRSVSTNGSAATESQHFRYLTVANQLVMRIMALYLAARSGTAGGVILRTKTAATAGSGGTAQTPAKKNGNDPVASTTWFNDATALTPGTTLTLHQSVGAPQTGGQGGYMPPESDGGLAGLPNGGANGNGEVYSIANGTAVPVDITVEQKEN